MRKLILTALLITTTVMVSRAQQSNRKVQLAILFDTSNSMDGLIDQAKSRIWSIVNEVSTLTYNGRTPSIEIAIYQYGNDGLEMSQNYIQQVVPLTSDLDDISQKLFGLRTNGGSEFCGAVIGKSLSDLKWSNSPLDLKMIYIAGNESFSQGPVDYKKECKKAAAKGIFINTIFCGNYDTGVQLFWKDGATCSEGDYFNIDSDRQVVQIDTPYDKDIMQYNDSLNGTYYGYGSLGMEKKAMQSAQDGNAMSESINVAAERTVAKSRSGVYKNSSWDLLDASDDENFKISEVKEEELPEEFKGKTTAEKKVLIEQKKVERQIYQKRIAELAKDRQAFIDVEMKKLAGVDKVDDFGTSVNKSIQTRAKEIGFETE
ncbi:MAG: hypothetical protein COA33_011990 [Fluviicola sp.]|nr:hypothetical protein [Fluviicola sp.]